jgi:hypothetical protein
MNKHFSLAVCAVCLLSACGGSPTAMLSVTNLTFADQGVGSTSAAQSIMLGNSGSATLHIDNIATTANFAHTDNCDSSVASKASCTINVTFTPPSAGNFLVPSPLPTTRAAVHTLCHSAVLVSSVDPKGKVAPLADSVALDSFAPKIHLATLFTAAPLR